MCPNISPPSCSAGYGFNLDGSTLYLALASIFVAQAAGIHLSLTTQVLMMLTLMLTSKGVASVRASLVVLTRRRLIRSAKKVF